MKTSPLTPSGLLGTIAKPLRLTLEGVKQVRLILGNNFISPEEVAKA